MPARLQDFALAIQQVLDSGGTRMMLRQVMPNHADDSAAKSNDIELRCVLAMIRSMTKDEREYPDQIHPNRARRIARGSGTNPEDVADLVRNFLNTRRSIQQLFHNDDWSVPLERRIWPLK